MVAWLRRKPYKAVAFDTMAAPGVDRVHLEEQVWSFRHLISLSQHLEVKREGEVADVLSSLNCVHVIDEFDCRLARVGH